MKEKTREEVMTMMMMDRKHTMLEKEEEEESLSVLDGRLDRQRNASSIEMPSEVLSINLSLFSLCPMH